MHLTLNHLRDVVAATPRLRRRCLSADDITNTARSACSDLRARRIFVVAVAVCAAERRLCGGNKTRLYDQDEGPPGGRFPLTDRTAALPRKSRTVPAAAAAAGASSAEDMSNYFTVMS